MLSYKALTKLEISQETEERSIKENIKNILLLGVDQKNATDTIMILSLDKDDNTAKLTSIMRDMYVEQGEGKANKINYAYHYGGVEGTISTLNELFNLDINKYALIDFDGLVEIIDYLGGINLNITEQERKLCGASNAGNVVLNGKEALAFSRIRRFDSDFVRTSRTKRSDVGYFKEVQRYTFNKLSFSNFRFIFKCSNKFIYYGIVHGSIFLLALDMNNLNDFKSPIDGTTKDNLNGVYHLDWDKDEYKSFT